MPTAKQECDRATEIIKFVNQLADLGEARIHFLKTQQPHFEEVWLDNAKKQETRFNDRGYKVGDYLILNEYNNDDDTMGDRWIFVLVTHILRSEDFPQALNPGWWVMSIFEIARYLPLEWD